MAEAPVITSAIANAPGWITIAWAHSGQDGALGYRLQRQHPPKEWTSNAHVGYVTDMELAPSTFYSYRICSVYASAPDECSEWIPVETMPPEHAVPVDLRPPPMISAHEVGQDFITIKWSGNTYERIHLFWREDSPGSSPLEARIDFDYDRPVGYRRFDGLRPSTNYTFRIQACSLNIFGAANCGPESWPPFPIATKGPVLPPEPPRVDPIYAIMANGDLVWHRHDGRFEGTSVWAPNDGQPVGSGWNGFPTVFSDGAGVIYAVTEISRDPRTGQRTGGNLVWYRHNGWHDGASRWAPNQGRQVGDSWNAFRKVFSGGEGVIYAVADNGDLLWYRHEGRSDGTKAWAPGAGKTVGSGWNGFSFIFSAGSGVIYAITEPSRDPRTGQHTGGDLLWYRHDGWADGGLSWALDDGKKMSSGWGAFPTVFSGGGGVLYAITEASRDPRTGQRTGGDLLWFYHDGWRDGALRWAVAQGKKVSRGWHASRVFAR